MAWLFAAVQWCFHLTHQGAEEFGFCRNFLPRCVRVVHSDIVGSQKTKARRFLSKKATKDLFLI